MSSTQVTENGFGPEAARSLTAADGESVRRVGVVDVGSNSVRLVVFDGVARSPAYFYNEKILCGLGKGLQETGMLDPEGRKRALSALHRFAALAKIMQVTVLTGVATAAVRDAKDGPAFRDQVERATGLSLEVATGEDEARLSAKGVLLGWPKATGIVCDIGGASMEMARVEGGKIGARSTSPLGPLRLAAFDTEAEQETQIETEVAALAERVGGPTQRLFLVGGSWRAIAKLDMERRGYPLKVLHEYRLTAEQVLETCDWLVDQSPEELSKLTDTSLARLELVPTAARVLRRVVQTMRPEAILISSYGLREGLLYRQMPASMRARDPLLEAARHMEQTRARFPGFGASLYAWLMPLFGDADREELRLIRAACYLHDITWRAHPDYRAEVCFETVTRANLSGLDHEGRVFLGAAIVTRYKASSNKGLSEDILSLLTPERQAQAETLGRALRLGAMLSGAAPGSLENTKLSRDDGTLTLTLRGPARALRGEAVDRRLRNLAMALELEPLVTLSAR
ncbi:Ppx/GppA family phosphatase [Oceanibium sediminis]|uniref:Ppx/GppA family phosphatase n=1 Tax=Oceanibium sediminis TaxID=2026339 RepID=UPI000DD3B0B4|nr:Ppx/GppA family phosphatase [Oceanibium sediminis]